MSDGPGEANGRRDGSSDGGSDEDASWVERFLMATSAAFTVALFAFVVWQAATTPAGGVPTAQLADTDTLPNDDVLVTVTFRNQQDVGLVVATVEVDCDTPPPELTFEHVPADDRRTGHVVCPPGTENPTVTVSTWIEA